MTTELLQASGLQTGYQRVQILWGVDIGVEEGETVVLLGANGAGKTTLLKLLVGLLPAWTGNIAFAGKDITCLRTDHRIHLGIAYMSEMGVFPSLTIDENIRVGGHMLPAVELNARARELYAIFPDLERRRRAPASSLSGGQRKMLGIAKALAGKPKLLIMDEPSAGLSPAFVQEVFRALDKSREHGLSLLVAEQNIKFLDLADRVYTLDGGRIGFQGTVPEMHANNALYHAYFGLRRPA
jgi:branched-chain amino acid transport system ATP-binding protein